MKIKKPIEDEELYKENILDHYREPHNKKELPYATNKHKEFNPSCGDEITIFLKIEQDKIIDISFTGSGCAISQAAASILTDELKDLIIKQAQSKLTKENMLKLLGVTISPARMNCALLALKTTLKALNK